MAPWYHDQVMSSFEAKYKKILEAARDPKTLDHLSDADKRALMEWLEHARYNWDLHARPQQQMPPGDWHTWLVLAGRGFGKTRVGSEAVRKLVRDHRYRAIGFIAATASDARDTMVDGKGGSSILEVTPQDEGLAYFPTKRRLEWQNGAVGTTFSAEEPQRLRGPQHDVLWCLVGSTRVLMADGSEEFISMIEPGDVVKTTGGDRTVFGTSSKESSLVEVVFANGSNLVGSKEHPVLTDRGWVGLGRLTKNDKIYTWTKTGSKTSKGTTAHTKMAKSSIGIGLFMKRPMDPFQRVGMSITRTVSRVMTALKTSWQSLLRHIGGTTHQRGLCEPVVSVGDNSFLHGTPSIARFAGAGPTSLPGSSLQDGVSTAEKLSQQGVETTVVRAVSTLGGAGRVYNLLIDGEHDFVANGIVTHNSDELAAWRYLEETWDMAQFGLRLGKSPKHIITTTPRPLPILRELMQDAVPASEMKKGMREKVVFTKGTTQDNQENLSPDFITDLMKRYKGTRLGRQEIYAEILDDNPNALFTQRNIDFSRVRRDKGIFKPGHEVQLEFTMAQGGDRPQSFKIAVDELIIAVDPAMSHDLESDETGIIVMAKDYANKKEDGNIYVLDDKSGIYSPNEWARMALNLYQQYNANAIIAEVNQGGDLVEHTIRTVEKEMDIGRVNYKQVRASKGKIARTEPVGALAEQGRLRHVGDLPKLEDQLISFAPGFQRSPDRLDAYVWGAHHLIVQRQRKSFYIF